jgi:hypothetical protein
MAINNRVGTLGKQVLLRLQKFSLLLIWFPCLYNCPAKAQLKDSERLVDFENLSNVKL